MKIKLEEEKVKEGKFIKKYCKIHYKSLKCKVCKKYLKSNKNIGKMYKKNGNINKKTLKLHNNLSKKCDKCSNNTTKECSSKQLESYSKWFNK